VDNPKSEKECCSGPKPQRCKQIPEFAKFACFGTVTAWKERREATEEFMMTTTTLARSALALAVFAAPLAAQIDVRHPGQGRGRSTTTTTTSDGSIYRSGTVLGSRTTSRTGDRVPPGQLPPRGMCRVWIDGVPPGQQPPVTDCATAQRNAYGRANAHVIYGDEQSFPGKGKGKSKNKLKNSSDRTSTARSCSVWDAVVVGGQQVPVCRDRTQRQGTVLDRRSRNGDDRIQDRDDDDDRDEGGNRFQSGDRGSKGRGHSKRGKGKGGED
jgi:hypothetical protein